MRVLGIDPGYDRLGLAILEHSERGEKLLYSTCLETDRSADITDRLFAVGERVSELIAEYEPDAIGIESLFFNKNQKTGMAVAEARGAILYLAKKARCQIFEYAPQEIKVAVTGYGKSDKEAVTAMVKRLVTNIPDNALDDEYDAIAVGITALAHNRR